MTPNSSVFIINRDPSVPFAAVVSCFNGNSHDCKAKAPTSKTASRHQVTIRQLARACRQLRALPRTSPRFGGSWWQRSDTVPTAVMPEHLFGLGLKEMLADEIDDGLRARRDAAVAQGDLSKALVTKELRNERASRLVRLQRTRRRGILHKSRGGGPGSAVKPFSRKVRTISIREFVVGALHNEMGLEASADPDLLTASSGGAWSRLRNGAGWFERHDQRASSPDVPKRK